MDAVELVGDVKSALRVTAAEFDWEAESLAAAALADMERAGVDRRAMDAARPLVVQAVCCFAKARFGADSDDAERFEAAYRQHLTDLCVSSPSLSRGRRCP